MVTEITKRSRPVTIVLCFLVALLEGFDIQAAGVAAPRLAATLDLSPHMLGLFFTASTVGMLLGAFVGGRASDRIGRKRVLLISVAIFGGCSILTGLANDFPMLASARFLTGLGLGGALPALIALVSEQAPQHRGRAVALMYAGTPLGGACSGIANALFADWQMIFHIGGILPLLVLPLLWIFLQESRAPVSSEHQRAIGIGRALFAPGLLVNTLMLWATFFLGLLVLYLMLNWTPTLLASRGFGRGEMALFQGTLNIVGAGVVMLASPLLDGRRLIPLAITVYTGGAIALLLVAWIAPGSGLLLIAVAGLLGATILTAQSILYATAPRLYAEETRGTGVGAAVGVGRGGSVAGPLLAAVILSAGVAPAQLILLTIPVVILGGVANVALLLRMR